MRKLFGGIASAAAAALLICCAACQSAGNGDAQRADPAAAKTAASQARLTPEAMGGADWVLRAWTAGDPAPPEPAVTLRFEGGRFAGHSGCNQYTAPVQAGKQPGDITLGPVAGTRMMCPEPAMGVEMRFLRSLGGVRRFSFVAGQLSLSYELEGTAGAMYFERAGAR